MASGRATGISALALGFAIAITGCADASGGVTDPATTAWAEQLRTQVSSTNPVLPPEIQSILLEAADAGEMSFDLYDRGMTAYVECLEDAGISAVTLIGPSEGGDGLLQYQVSYQFPTGVQQGDPEEIALSSLANDCDVRYSWPVAISYVSQPSAQEARDSRFIEYRPAVVACLRENGSTVDTDAPEDEVANEINRVAETGPDCGLKTGYWTP